jgi:ATP-dependent RNA helicase RhlE
MSFALFNLPFNIASVLQQQNIKKPYPIQEQAIPAILKGDDVLGIAPTGSGKTLSYVIPALTQLSVYADTRARHPQVLIMVPTRELALQVQEVVKLFVDPNRYQSKTVAAYGGTSMNPQMKAMTETKVLIATPGRLLDLVESNAVKLEGLKMLVIDEADKLLNSGFKEEIDKILKLIPLKCQKILFSATLSPEVQHLKKLILNQPLTIQITAQPKKVAQIKQEAFSVSPERKGPLLRYLIKEKAMVPALIFTSSIKEADKVADKLTKNGVPAQAVHSKKSQHARNTALEDFKQGETKVLVTTDLLSRGIDIEALAYVINYELPRSPKDYIHRVGRTGRADHSGVAVSLISPEEEKHFEVIQKKMNAVVELVPTADIELHGF